MTTDPVNDPVFTSSVFYRDPKAALAWLERAFGFETTMAIDGPPEAPEMCHYEMSLAGRDRLGRAIAARRRDNHCDDNNCLAAAIAR